MNINNKESGFTIVELLIVIVVIAILTALVVTTFSGIETRERNTERETDIKAIHRSLEAYYAQNGWYPDLADLNTTKLRGMDVGDLTPPNSTNTPAATFGTPAYTNYRYAPAPGTCTTAAQDCTSYELETELEGGGKFEKK